MLRWLMIGLPGIIFCTLVGLWGYLAYTTWREELPETLYAAAKQSFKQGEEALKREDADGAQKAFQSADAILQSLLAPAKSPDHAAGWSSAITRFCNWPVYRCGRMDRRRSRCRPCAATNCMPKRGGVPNGRPSIPPTSRRRRRCSTCASARISLNRPSATHATCSTTCPRRGWKSWTFTRTSWAHSSCWLARHSDRPHLSRMRCSDGCASPMKSRNAGSNPSLPVLPTPRTFGRAGA